MATHATHHATSSRPVIHPHLYCHSPVPRRCVRCCRVHGRPASSRCWLATPPVGTHCPPPLKACTKNFNLHCRLGSVPATCPEACCAPSLPTHRRSLDPPHLYCCAQKRCSLLPVSTSPARAARSSTNWGVGAATAHPHLQPRPSRLYSCAQTRVDMQPTSPCQTAPCVLLPPISMPNPLAKWL